MASTVRVKIPPPVINIRRTSRRIYDKEMGLEEASASHGQDEQGADNVRQVPAGSGQDKQSAEDVRKVPAGCGQDKQGPGDAKQAPAGHRKSRVGPEPPPGFLRQIGLRHNKPIVPMWHWNRIYPGDPFTPRNIKFTGKERVLVPLPRNPTAKDFFKLYMTEQTNLYTQQFIEQYQSNLRPQSLVHQWKATDRAEILTLLAFIILMGVVHKPRFAMYWSTDSLITTPIFSQIISRDRFPILMSFLHFAGN